MKHWLSKISSIFDKVLDLTGILAAIMLTLIMLIVCYEVVMRYFFHSGVDWAADLTSYAILIVAFLGSAWLLRDEGHVSIDLLSQRVSKKTRNILQVIMSLICVVLFLGLTWFGTKITITFYREGAMLVGGIMVPKSAVVLFIPLGSILLLIQFVRRTVLTLRKEAP